MEKEPLTLANVKKDLIKVTNHRLRIADDWRFSFIVPFSLLAVTLGVVLKSIFLGILVSLPAVYHLIHYIRAVRRHKAEKRAVLAVISRGALAISEEELDHVETEMIYEPHTHTTPRRARTHYTKTVTLFHFKAGGSWRFPDTRRHYEWSRELHLSRRGLQNIAVEGNIFYRISVQGHFDISYIYPAKFFTLGEDLKKQNRS